MSCVVVDNYQAPELPYIKHAKEVVLNIKQDVITLFTCRKYATIALLHRAQILWIAGWIQVINISFVQKAVKWTLG